VLELDNLEYVALHLECYTVFEIAGCYHVNIPPWFVFIKFHYII
jgi:hypothetical protein